MKKRIPTMLLTFSLLLGTVTGCGGSHNVDTAPVDSRTVSDTDTAEDSTIDTYVRELAAGTDFGGASFSYIGRDGYDNFPAEEAITGQLLSDALYNRQCDIEELFGIDVVNIITADGSETKDMVIRDVAAGGDSYDLVYGSMLTVGQPLLIRSSIMPVDDFDAVDLSRDWWLSELSDTFSIEGRLYYLTGAIVPNNFRDAYCMAFNKEVAASYGISDLYETVRAGEWTTDRMFEVASAVPANSTGAGAYRYGHPTGYAFIFAGGLHITDFDSDGIPTVSENLPSAFSDLADRISAVFGDDTLTCIQRVSGSTAEDIDEKYGVDDMYDMFRDGRVLFWFDNSDRISDFREDDVEFGILPLPKGEGMSEYRTVGWDSAAVYVPRGTHDTSMTDKVIEAMAALSQKYLKSAFYDKLLKGRSTYDSESRDMIDIIFATKHGDLIESFSGGDMNSRGDFLNLIERAVTDGNDSLASSYRACAKLINANIRQTVKSIGK